MKNHIFYTDKKFTVQILGKTYIFNNKENPHFSYWIKKNIFLILVKKPHSAFSTREKTKTTVPILEEMRIFILEKKCVFATGEKAHVLTGKWQAL